MTQERFFRILNDPDLLANISYEELKTLALAYPYAHNLRYLLALKAHKIDHPEANRTLSAAAMYSLDRTQLFIFMAPKAIVPQKLMEEEVLELKPIETVRQELEALSPLPRQERQSETEKMQAITPPVEEVRLKEEKVIFEARTEPDMPEATELVEPVQIKEAPELPVPPVVQAPVPKPAPEPFASWVGRFQPPALEPIERKPLTRVPPEKASEQLEEPEPQPERPAAKPAALPAEKGIAQQLAERSVSENKDVISETLARLLARQGHKEKAIAMYERLSLAFPEKSAYFAAEIENLKN